MRRIVLMILALSPWMLFAGEAESSLDSVLAQHRERVATERKKIKERHASCVRCKGTNEVVDTELCTTCHGSGLISTRKGQATISKPCATCSGKGSFESRTPCPRCCPYVVVESKTQQSDQKPEVKASAPEKQKCTACSGKGYHLKEVGCGSCNGSGTIVIPAKQMISGWTKERRSQCTACSGRGKKSSRERCRTCNGSGNLKQTKASEHKTSAAKKEAQPPKFDLVKWLTWSAEQGNAKAQYCLGVMYATGDGVTKSAKDSEKWLKISADKGNAFARRLLEQQDEIRLEVQRQQKALAAEKEKKLLAEKVADKTVAEASKSERSAEKTEDGEMLEEGLLSYVDSKTGISWTYSVSNRQATVRAKHVVRSGPSYENTPGIKTSTKGELVIPESLGGYPVTGIGPRAFINCSNLTAVRIPSGVKTIDYGAFSECHGLESVTLPASVTRIGSWAFTRCRNLASIDIPVSVTNIGSGAFMGCARLTEVHLPPRIKTIEGYLLSGCSNLESLSLPAGVKNIGDNAFSSSEKLTSVTIPEGVTNISEQAFVKCVRLKSLDLPAGLISLGDSVASWCERLESISLPASLQRVGDLPFGGCESLREIKVHPDNKYFEIVDGMLCSKAKRSVIRGVNVAGEVVVPAGIVKIEGGAFASSKDLKTVVLNEGLGVIWANAFYDCKSLESIAVPRSVKVILDDSLIGKPFSHCPELKTVYVAPGDAERVSELTQWPEDVSFVEVEWLSQNKILPIPLPLAIAHLAGFVLGGLLLITLVKIIAFKVSPQLKARVSAKALKYMNIACAVFMCAMGLCSFQSPVKTVDAEDYSWSNVEDLRTAAELGVAPAQCILADALLKGRSTDIDYDAPFEMAERQKYDAVFLQGYRPTDAARYDGPTDDAVSEAAFWYLRAADQGYAPAMVPINRFRNLKEKIGNSCRGYLAEAVRQGYLPALADSGDSGRLKAAEAGYAPAQYWSGSDAHHALGVEGKSFQGLSWCIEAAKQGHAKAQLDVALSFYLGDNGVEKDRKKALDLMESLTDRFPDLAVYFADEIKLQHFFEIWQLFQIDPYDNVSSLEKNPVTHSVYSDEELSDMIRFYRIAAEVGRPAAQYCLGECLLFRLADGPRFDNATKQKLIPILYKLDSHPESLLSVVKLSDIAEPLSWFRKAAEQGYERAIKILDGLNGQH